MKDDYTFRDIQDMVGATSIARSKPAWSPLTG